MNCTGKLLNIVKDYQTDKFQVTFEVNEKSAISEIEAIKDCELLSIEAKKYRKKRSLDANAYCWVLLSKIAEVDGRSKEEVYEEMLQHYPVPYQDEDGYITITVKNIVDMSKIGGHWMRYKGNDKFTSYIMLKGTSEYDSAEMAKFIDRIIEEAKERSIETLTPSQLAEIKALWGAK